MSVMGPPTTTTTTTSIFKQQNQNWYKVLGVRHDASKEEIKAAYKRLSLAWHPDRHIDDKNMATTKYAEISNAYRAIMLERHIAAVKARQEAANAPPSGATESRPPIFSRPSWSTRRGSSTSTLPSTLNSSSRQSSFESVTTAPSTPRFLTRSLTKNTDTSSTFQFDRPLGFTPPAQSLDEALQDYFSLPSPISPVIPGSPKLFSSSMADIPEIVNGNNEHGSDASQTLIEQPSHAVSQSRNSLWYVWFLLEALTWFNGWFSSDVHIVYDAPKPQPPYSVKKPANFFGSRPEVSPRGIGTSREWKYSLIMSLEDLYHGKACRFRITRYLLSGEKTDVVLDVEIAPGTQPGTKISFKGVGHERPDHTFQDIAFVVQQANHDKFSRDGDDLAVNVTIPHFKAKSTGSLCFTGIDGVPLEVRVDCKEKAGSYMIVGAGMPKVVENEVVGRGNLTVQCVVSRDFFRSLSADAYAPGSWSVSPPPMSRWRRLRSMLWFRK
ncbi:hypothetical protein VNI00_004959 [Paramarasmius palmivorus]|uniref:J domain-containing protein n=1 Tax=Paramarasmius palmivorus TaxID=297713 RepID=A0AAW0DHK6_9AGAR